MQGLDDGRDFLVDLSQDEKHWDDSIIRRFLSMKILCDLEKISGLSI
jgi:hypothetical protein